MLYGHKYRDRIDIIGHILEAANEGSMKKTKIMTRVFLSHRQLNEYLSVLTEGDLLCYDSGTGAFKTTEKGLRFLDSLNQMSQMVATNKSTTMQGSAEDGGLVRRTNLNLASQLGDR